MSASDCFLYRAYYSYFYKPRKDTVDEFTHLFSMLNKGITVVQIGANDGIHNDPVHKFIKRDRWKGILLEPQRYVFERYLRPLYMKNKRIKVLNAALDVTDGKKPIYKVSVSNSRWATGLTSFNRSVLEEAVRSGYIDHQARKEGCTLPVSKDDYIIEEMVECINTDTLISRYGIENIDWLQIDTEGFDFEIIKMFNITVTRPSVIAYENLHFPESLKDECKDYLRMNGYSCRDFGPNTIAMLNPSGDLLRFFIQ
jgi:FkbM family methyltransferase